MSGPVTTTKTARNRHRLRDTVTSLAEVQHLLTVSADDDLEQNG